MIRIFVAVLWLTLCQILLGSASAFTPTPEVPDLSLGDIAAVFPNPASPTGAVIVYNPTACQQMGTSACEFFRIHEHAHVALGHQFQAYAHPMIRERDADQMAAARATPDAVLAAWQLFMNGGSSSNWHTYGTPYQRANRLCHFAQAAGNWFGPNPCP
jgi:hypothetical protein